MEKSTKILITDFEFVNHGVQHPMFFHGCGVSNTDYFGVVTGQGDSEYEAYEDACEILASTLGGVDVSIMDKSEVVQSLNKEITLTHSQERGELYEESPWYYFSIRYNLPEEKA